MVHLEYNGTNACLYPNISEMVEGKVKKKWSNLQYQSKELTHLCYYHFKFVFVYTFDLLRNDLTCEDCWAAAAAAAAAICAAVNPLAYGE